jgi:type II secretory pathway pseudopilin PulG
VTVNSISLKRPDAITRRTSRAGTTLVEVLVVIVVLLVGILAVVQIFPSGLRILALNRSETIAIQLAQDEAERVTGRADHLADEIIPVTYRYDTLNSRVAVFSDADRNPEDFSLIGNGQISDANGDVVDGAGHSLAYWPYVSGPNLFRRVIGEGGRVPAPRQVGSFFGGLMILQFTPIVYNASVPGLFQIYGEDMVRKEGPPQTSDVPRPYEYYVENIDLPSANLILPADGFAERDYRLAMACYIQSGTTTFKRDIVDVTIKVAPITGGGFYTLPIAAGDVQNPNPLGLTAGETFQSAELDSVRVARIYDKIDVTDTFSDPYQYKLLDADLGLILFSDSAFNAYELRNGHRVPLQARVNYDVYDWRVIRDEFRVPEGVVPQVKLELGNLKVKGMRDVDATTYNGLSLNLPTGTGTPERRDIALLDMDTGGIILTKSATRMVSGKPKELITVDRGLGRLIFLDADGDPSNGVTGEIVYPGSPSPSATDINLTGRAIRAMYQARGEWSAQVTKAPALFTGSNGRPGVAQYYVGGPSGTIGGNPTRIYFANCESGHRVSIDQIWYKDSSNPNAQSLENQSFVIQSLPADSTGLPYVDIKSVNPDAQSFDSDTNGYAVNGVHGASINVRVLWNPSNLSFDADAAKNLQALDTWAREWRRTSVETYAKRSAE